MGDLGNIIVATGPKCNKSPNLVTLAGTHPLGPPARIELWDLSQVQECRLVFDAAGRAGTEKRLAENR